MRLALLLVATAAYGQLVKTVPDLWRGALDPAPYAIAISAASHRVAYTLWKPHAFTLKKVQFRVHSFTTGDTLRVAVYNVDSSFHPTGSPLAYTDINITAAGYYVATFTSAVSLSASTLYAVVLEFPSYNGGNFTVPWAPYTTTYPFGFCRTKFDGTAWGSFMCNGLPMGFEDVDGNPLFYFGSLLHPSIRSFRSTSSPNERGIACMFDAPTWIIGAAHQSGYYVSGEGDINLYRAGTLIRAVQATRGTRYYHQHVATMFEPVLAAPGVEYIIAFKPKSATDAQFYVSSSYSVFQPPFNTLAGWIWEWSKGKCHTVYRTNAGSWTYDDSVHHAIAFLVEVAQ